MAIKQNRWPAVVIIFILFGVAIAFMWMKVIPPDVEIRDAVLARIRAKFAEEGMKEGEGYSIGDVKIVSLDDKRALTETVIRPSGAVVHHEVLLLGVTWTVTKNMFEDFAKYHTLPENEVDYLRRLGTRIKDRYEMDVNFKRGLPRDYVIFSKDDKILGKAGIRFAYPRVDNKQKRGAYEELFAYENGAWVLQGGGKLMDLMDRPKR